MNVSVSNQEDLSNDYSNSSYDDYSNYTISTLRYSLAVTGIYCFAYVFVFVVGIIGNVLVMMVVARTRVMKTTVFYFLFNLALADLLVLLFCLPATLLANVLNPWVLGWFICKSVSYLQGVSVSASINTLVAISVDRALAICYPMKCQVTSRVCRAIIVFIWIISLLISLPWAVFFKLEPYGPIQVCVDVWPNENIEIIYYLVAHLTMCYLLPLLVISVCYILIWWKVWWRQLPGEQQNQGVASMIHRSKMKVIKMLCLVIILFALSWLPLYVIFTWVKIGAPSETDFQVINVIIPIAQWVGASNSCINPILYAFFNNKFRAGFKAIIVSKSCISPLRLETHNASVYSSRHFTCSNSTASSRLSVYSSSPGRPSRKSVVVQIQLDAQGSRSRESSYSPAERKRSVPSDKSPSLVLYKQCIRNNFSNGSATESNENFSETSSCASVSISSKKTSYLDTPQHHNGRSTPV